MCETPSIWEFVIAMGTFASIFIGMLWVYVAILKWGDGW